jgi:predicted CxxxxCH...CXXCH cytochrome family protein
VVAPAGGTAGSGGTVGAAGMGGGAAGITGNASTSDAGASSDGGSAPTFTQVYNSILTASCSGSACHNPGTQHGISFANQSSAYSAVRNRVVPGDGEGSSFYYTVYSGKMPPEGPKLSAASLALIRAWIDAGALDD